MPGLINLSRNQMEKKQVKCYIDTEFKVVNLGTTTAIQAYSMGIHIPSQENTGKKSFGWYENLVDSNYDTGDTWLNENVIAKINSNQTPFTDETTYFLWGVKLKDFFDKVKNITQCDEFVLVCDFTAYDWVVFTSWFGGYFGIPECISKDPIDLASIAYKKGILNEVNEMYKGMSDTKYQHNAYYDALVTYRIDEEFNLTK